MWNKERKLILELEAKRSIGWLLNKKHWEIRHSSRGSWISREDLTGMIEEAEQQLVGDQGGIKRRWKLIMVSGRKETQE